MYERKIPKDLSCGLAMTMEIIGGKWKRCIIMDITNGLHRPSQLHRNHSQANRRVINQQLSELENDGIIYKVISAGLPLKVEYFLTELGQSLIPILSLMVDWGENYLQLSTGPALTIQRTTDQSLAY